MSRSSVSEMRILIYPGKKMNCWCWFDVVLYILIQDILMWYFNILCSIRGIGLGGSYKNDPKITFLYIEKWLKKSGLKCILRTPIHPLKGDSPYSPFHSPFLRVNHPSRRVNGSLKRRFTLQKGWTHSPLRVNHPSVRVNPPPKGWIILLKGEWSIRVNWKRVNEGWITLFKGEWKKIWKRYEKIFIWNFKLLE